ncbi:MAG: hypothetical protein JWQ14_1239 [Adhaeribacter sp.]|jgi:hypothetical protein|nr:hypothetical protein [Adhaeribacter sp.]
MLNFFYYFYYRIREAQKHPGKAAGNAAGAAYFTLVILLMLNGLSGYFLLMQLLHNNLTSRLWQDEHLNQLITLFLGIAIPAGVYGWYKFRQPQIEQTLLDFKSESSDERRVGGALIMAYIFTSCGLLLYTFFLPFL